MTDRLKEAQIRLRDARAAIAADDRSQAQRADQSTQRVLARRQLEAEAQLAIQDAAAALLEEPEA